ncbi:MAG: DegV family protein [Lachnospiraceae bacterium]|nr:DegV family protein [Lachnospiraceae bacterium]MDD3794513.1 DegV family protein [Lachnospiraceae bacterium]
MSYIIVIDSCGEMTEEMKKDPRFISAPLSMQVDEYDIVDDATFDQADFLKKVAASPNSPKSACPSPEFYKTAYEGEADHIYAVTLSAELSGSYNSAQLGKALFQEENPDKKIYIFNSKSASIGETLIALKIQECEEAGMPFDTLVETVEAYIAEQNTWFVLESLETLRKNGRLSNLKALAASVLKIKPVMMATPEGNIAQLDQARGINKALVKMVSSIAEITEHPENKILAISHCNCRDRAMLVKEALMEKMKLKDIFVLDTAGISSMYANDGGIIVVV